MVWYTETASHMEKGKPYTHQDVLAQLRTEHPQLSENSYHWAVHGMLKSGALCKTGFDEYYVADGQSKPVYYPAYSDAAIRLRQQIQEQFPHVRFCMFETVLMNDFLNHLIAQNTIIVQVEKESSIFVFRYLQEQNEQNLMYKPSKKDFALYWAPGSIVVEDMISESPLRSDHPSDILLEKMLVDMYCDKLIATTYSTAEYLSVMSEARRQYGLDQAKMLRYARRRGKGAEIKRYLEDENAKA